MSVSCAALAGEPVAVNANSGIEEVIVTARKSKERLKDVPIAITALDGSALGDAGHIRIEDLNQLAPSTNVVITNGHQTSFSVRGIGGNPGNDGLESSTGVFLDGVYLGRPGMAAMDLIDLNQIELLRGPQGTLFGKNTTAGAVNITTAKPSFEFGGKAQINLGNYGFEQYQATVTGPLADNELAVRLTGFSTKRDGVVKNLTTGQDTSTLNRQGVRGQILFEPSGNFSVRLIGEYAREQQSAGAVFTYNSFGATPSVLQKKLAVVGTNLVPDKTGLTTFDDTPDRTGTRQLAGSAEINWDIGGFSLTSLTAYRMWRYMSFADVDGTSAPVAAGGYNIRDNQISQEFRAKLPAIGPVDTVAGIYYFRQVLHMNSQVLYGSDAAAWLTGIPNSLLPTYAKLSPAVAGIVAYNNSTWDTNATPVTDSLGAFGQAVWHVSPVWNFTAGFRQTHETKDETVSRPIPVATQTGIAVPALGYNLVTPFNVGVKANSPSWLLSTDYHLSSDLMVYASASHGEKAGGVNPVIPATGASLETLKVRPESATDFEAGFKSEWLDRHLTIDANLFYTDVSDYQATYITTINGTVVSLLTNVGKVRTQGIELESRFVPVTGLTLSNKTSFNDAIYASYPSGPCPAGSADTFCNLTHRPVAGAPRWISNSQVRYEYSMLSNLSAYADAEYSYRSHFFGYLDDSPYSRTGGYGLVNLRAGIKDAKGRWDFSLWAKNVTNEHYAANYLSYGALVPGAYVPFFGDPQTYGVTLRASF